MLRDSYFLPSPDHAVELRAFTHGLMPKAVPRMMQHFIEDWQHHGVDAWNHIPNHWLPDSGDPVGWWTLPEYLGDQFIAPLLGAPAGTCILQPNVHWTVQCLLSSRELFQGSKNKVILSEGEFPSVLHSVYQWADLLNIELICIPLEHGKTSQAKVLSAIDDRTALVILSHVGFTTGCKLTDTFIQEVSKKVHDHSGLIAIDGYHSIGSTTSTVQDLGVDLYFGGLLKEGSGSSGNAYVYIKEGVDLTPRTTGWFGDAAPFAFQQHPSPHATIRSRFKGGTTSVASFYHSVEGVRLLLNAGLDTVRKDSIQKTDYCIYRAQKAGIKICSSLSEKERSAMFVMSIPEAHLLSNFLKSRDVYTDSRKNTLLRIAPFVWNTRQEIEHTFSLIEEALRKKLHHSATLSNTSGPVT